MKQRLLLSLALLLPLTASALFGEPAPGSAIVYDLRFPDLTEPRIEVEMLVPTAGRETLDLVMAVWSPGYYRREDYATRIERFSAHDDHWNLLPLEVVAPNRWRVETHGASRVVVRYALRCDGEQSVTLNWVSEAWGMINGPATFLAVEGETDRPHAVRIHAPAAWPQVKTALPALRSAGSFHFGAADFDTLVDSPILAGKLKVWEFEVEGIPHELVSGGDLEGWDGERAVADLQRMVRSLGDYWGFLPSERYLFLNVHREGGGGLEHRNSTLMTASPRRVATPAGYDAWLGLAAHEYAHAYNGKRLRPVKLGPFDYLNPPTTESLWIAEGLTVHISEQILCRAGLNSWEQFLETLSFRIGRLQASPGRQFQTLRDASTEVWTRGRSGLIEDLDRSVSYYLKGQVVGLLLDVEIQRVTQGERSLQDLMRLAYSRYSGERGFTPAEFQQTASEVAGIDLGPWFEKALYSTEELDYQPMLDWYGLEFVTPEVSPEAQNVVTLKLLEDATAAQRGRLEGCGG